MTLFVPHALALILPEGKQPGDVVAIDHELLVAVEHKFGEYVESVEQVVVGIANGTDRSPLEDIVAYVSAHSGYEPHRESIAWLEEGFMEGLRRARGNPNMFIYLLLLQASKKRFSEPYDPLYPQCFIRKRRRRWHTSWTMW